VERALGKETTMGLFARLKTAFRKPASTRNPKAGGGEAQRSSGAADESNPAPPR